MSLGATKYTTKEKINSKETKFFIITVVINHKNEILGIKKRVNQEFLELCEIDYDPGEIWFAPSNYQLKGESREEAAKRIVLQETGYKVEVRYQIPDTLVYHYRQNGHSFFKITILCDVISKEKNFQKSDYVREIQWFTKEELLQNILPEIKNKWPESLRKILIT